MRPDRRLRPVPADDQPPPEGAARGRAARPASGAAPGSTTGPPRGDGRAGDAVRRPAGDRDRTAAAHERHRPRDPARGPRTPRSCSGCPPSTGSCRCGSASRWSLGLLLGRLVPGLDDALDAVKVGVGLAADRARPAGDDVPGAGQGPLRRARPRHRRPAAAGLLAGAQLGRRPGADVRPGLAAAARPARVPHRPDHRRAGPLHRHGAHLERPGLRRPRGRRRPGRAQLRLPGPRLRRCSAGSTCEVLPGWLGLAPGRRCDVSVWEIARSRAGLPRHPAGSPGSSPAPFGERAKGRDWYESRVPAEDRPGRPVRAAVHHRRSCSPCRATRSPTSRCDVARIALPLLAYFALMWAGVLRARPARSAAATRAPRRSPSPPRATTSSSPSPSPSASSASPPARPSPASSAR